MCIRKEGRGNENIHIYIYIYIYIYILTPSEFKKYFKELHDNLHRNCWYVPPIIKQSIGLCARVL